MSNLEMQKQSRGSHRRVATRFNNEAENIMSKDLDTISEADINRLNQVATLLTRKQNFLVTWNQELQQNLTEAEALDNDILESEEVDDKLTQNIDAIKRFTKRFEGPSTAVDTSRPSTSTLSDAMTNSANIKLPKLYLPFFSGYYMEWTSFFDLFKGAVIDNSSLQGSQKLQYLKTSVKGDAAKLLASIPVTDHNFDIAMNTLINRYENKRIIIRTHLHSIVSYRSLTTDNARDLRKLIEAMDEHQLALQNLGESVNSQDIFFVYLISEKLPTETRKQWELSSKGREPQRNAELGFFLEERAQALEATAPNGVGATKTQMNGNQRHLHTHLATSEQQCECFEETHKIFKCRKFKKLSVREELIKVRKLCFNCLRPGHRSEDCDGSKCKQCGRKHHTLLHRENIHNRSTDQQTTSGTTSTQANDKQKNNAITTTAIAKSKDENKFTGAMTQRTSEEVFLQTAIVSVNVHGETILLTAFLDSASQNNLITETAVQRLQLKKKSSNTKVFGPGGTVQDNEVRVDLFISSRNRSSTVNISASILTKMTDNLPSRFIDTSQWETVKELELADPDFNKPSSIDLLIGASHYEDIMIGNNRLKELNCGITYRLSMFGWVVIGREQTDKTYTNNLQTFFVSSEPENLQRF